MSVSGRHHSDFYGWTRDQAARLRQLALEPGSPVGLDWRNLADEIETLGRLDRREIESRLVKLLVHLARLAWSTEEAPRRGWRLVVDEQRDGIADRIEDSQSLRVYPLLVLAKCWDAARRRAEVALELPDDSLPGRCPWALEEEILNPAWLPEAEAPLPAAPDPVAAWADLVRAMNQDLATLTEEGGREP